MFTAGKDRFTAAALAAAFLAAVVLANLIIGWEGPSATPYVALGLVAFDLTTRDVLHDRLRPGMRLLVIGALIIAGALISWHLSDAAANVARASAVAFAASLTLDTLVYHRLRYLPWVERSGLSNIASAITDSALFIALAFPGFLWGVFIVQAGMKIAGGFILALLIERVLAVGAYARQWPLARAADLP
jgi:uncharacterized PurR-regulated membrane protein YhhQ (DUF165 family)